MQDFFAFYGIPLSFFPDETLIRKRFYEISRGSHPDLHSGQLGEEEALRVTMLNNEAYRVLSSFGHRLPYLLELKGILSAGEKYELSPAFLMEMMELNEEILETRAADPSGLSALKKKTAGLESELELVLKDLCSSYDKRPDESILPEIKDLYYRRKYLQRLSENLI